MTTTSREPRPRRTVEPRHAGLTRREVLAMTEDEVERHYEAHGADVQHWRVVAMSMERHLREQARRTAQVRAALGAATFTLLVVLVVVVLTAFRVLPLAV